MAAYDKESTAAMIEREISGCSEHVATNRAWDVAFRVIILILGISTVVCSGAATSDLVDSPKLWSLLATILAAISAALSGFAVKDFAFARRRRNWTLREGMLKALLAELQLTDPDPKDFLSRLNTALSINDETNFDAQTT